MGRGLVQAGLHQPRTAFYRASEQRNRGHITQDAAKHTGLLVGTPVINGAGDMTSEAIGSGAIEEGELHVSVGTSGWVAGHVSKRCIDLAHYAGCIGSAYPDEYYLAMGHQETCGICLEWMKNKVLYHEELLKMEEKCFGHLPIARPSG